MLATALLALSMILGACTQDPQQGVAEQNKARLDRELQHARVDLGIPNSLLSPITSQEQAIAAGAGGRQYSYQDAASNYTLLYIQLQGIEQTAVQTLKQQAQTDLQAFATAVSTRRAEGFSEVGAYQERLDQAFQDLGTAATAGDYARVDAGVRAQTAALNALDPAYKKLQEFRAAIDAVQRSGFSTSSAELEYEDDAQIFRDAAPVERYQKLVGIIDGQILQLMADQTEALPYIGSALLDAFQDRINELKRFGEKTAAFQQQHDDDASALAATKTLADYLTLGQVIDKQTSAMWLPYYRGKTRYDLAQLRRLIASIQAGGPLLAYEYASSETGIGIPAYQLQFVTDTSGYQRVDDDVQVLLSNLRALQDNLHDTTPVSKAHQADLDLMSAYHIIRGKTIVISLREQVARFYDNGTLVYWSYVTTGRPEKPSPPGLHYAMEKDRHIEFKSSDPPGSPLWYAPTPINYAILYANYGYFLHDAYWRYQFGPGSNLPHWDPLAFNTGSHGCINFPEDNMGYVFNWTPQGAPIIVY
jgi:hypothetical protein